MTEMDGNAVEPEIMLPVQFSERQYGAQIQPEKRLQLAVLADALRIHARLGADPATRRRILFVEVEEWFASEDADGPFSFVGICDSLNLDPEYVRSGLQAAVAPSAPKRRLFLRRDSGSRTHVVRPRFSQVA